MPSPLYSQFASLVNLIGIAASATVLILALVRARHRGRALVVAGAAVILAGNMLSELAQGSANLLGSTSMAGGSLQVIFSLGILASLMVGVGIVLLAVGLVRGHGNHQRPPQEPIPTGQTFPAPPPGSYPRYQGWPSDSGAPGHDQGWGPR
ncbi:hypothetical protein [Acidipropionibacterium virtanenii]|uniref:Uncharacterized protein n=1 Tax=Acidipropionibacterium virtanenii TaxID=2057246 RepID=A0A344UQ48_9ACTN|nr:hypothetical protein [Acidipropionibacterium virtanenii]AXE37396.1 hypothetical protein JS278_00199 [Acidipropionibacterium virtanenii]